MVESIHETWHINHKIQRNFLFIYIFAFVHRIIFKKTILKQPFKTKEYKSPLRREMETIGFLLTFQTWMYPAICGDKILLQGWKFEMMQKVPVSSIPGCGEVDGRLQDGAAGPLPH